MTSSLCVAQIKANLFPFSLFPFPNKRYMTFILMGAPEPIVLI